jgi:hypothetical protein
MLSVHRIEPPKLFNPELVKRYEQLIYKLGEVPDKPLVVLKHGKNGKYRVIHGNNIVVAAWNIYRKETDNGRKKVPKKKKNLWLINAQLWWEDSINPIAELPLFATVKL